MLLITKSDYRTIVIYFPLLAHSNPKNSSHRHGVSGGGGSNPLVPTKTPLRTRLYGWFFYACFLYGETQGDYWGETIDRLPANYVLSGCNILLNSKHDNCQEPFPYTVV